MRRFFRQFDVSLFLLPVLLLLTSATVIFALVQNHVVADGTLWIKQLIFGLVGLLAAVGLTFVDYRHVRPFAVWLYAGSIVLLIFVLGTERVFGSARWFQLGFFQFQPSEFFKLILVLFVASLLADRIGPMPLKLVALLLAAVILPSLLVLAQPDLGTTIVLAASSIGLLFVTKLTTWQRFTILGCIVAVSAVFVLAAGNIGPFGRLLKPYQRSRIETFINPKSDPLGSGYNVTQSIIAVGSGGLRGRGLGQSSESNLRFVPAPATDFIYASFAESYGYIGGVVFLVVVLFLLIRIMFVAEVSRDEFGMFVALGIFLLFLTQLFVNVGMTMGVTPVTGIPLPFMSYGGSHILTDFFAIGLLQSIVIRQKRLDFRS